MKEIVQRLQEKRNIEVAKSILESAGYTVKRLNESWPPILNSLGRQEKELVRIALLRAGIDIQNTEYEEIELSGARDPRIKDPSAIIIFPITTESAAREGYRLSYSAGDFTVGVWHNGAFVFDVEMWHKRDLNNVSLRSMSWKKVLAISETPVMIKFDQDINMAMNDKRLARRNSRKGMPKRFSQKEINSMPLYKSKNIDKSGYMMDPDKYKDMLASMKIKDGEKILADAKEVYVKLAQNLSAENMKEWGGFDTYEYIIREIPERFKRLSTALKEFNENPDEASAVGSWTRRSVVEAINGMRDIIKKAQKYI